MTDPKATPLGPTQRYQRIRPPQIKRQRTEREGYELRAVESRGGVIPGRPGRGRQATHG